MNKYLPFNAKGKQHFHLNNIFKRSVFLTVLTLIWFTAEAALQTGPRNRVNLDGTWSFSTTADGPSFTLPEELPAGYAPKEAGKIQVPGIWDAQGYGLPTDKVRHNFVGCGWYRRDLHIPADWPSENSVYLVLTGISRYAKVWIDGKPVGKEAIGCIGSHEWNITPYVKPGGSSTVVICVDSRQRWDIDPLLGTAQLNDFMEVAWGGIWGHVYAESRPRTRLDGIYLQTRIDYDRKGDVGKVYYGVRATITDEDRKSSVSGTLRMKLFDAEGKLVASARKKTSLDLSKGDADIELWALVPSANLWTPDTPYLYDAEVTFSADKGAEDVLRHRHGLKEIRIEGKDILLNGKPLYLIGYGDDHVFPEQFSMSADIDLYRRRLKMIKEYGFNHCRTHSIVMPHEYYDACDEIGIMPSPEMLIAYPFQLPGVGQLWLENVNPGTSPDPANRTIVERFRAVVREYRNHPSIFSWVGGNELMFKKVPWKDMDLRKRCLKAAKEEDPSRPFMDSDGTLLWLHERDGGLDTQEYYSLAFHEGMNPFTTDKYIPDEPFTKPFLKPVVVHEMGNYLTFSRTDGIDRFDKTNFFPFWMSEGRDRLRKLGLENEVEDWALASEQLYLASHKYSIETARRHREISGYHFWLINDYWTSSNGLFDHFFRRKSIKPEDMASFNAPVVVLQKGLKFSYVGGEQVACDILVSNYGPEALHGGFSYSLAIDGKVVSTKRYEGPAAECGEITSPVQAVIRCPDVERPTRVEIRADFETKDRTFSNAWSAYILPEKIAPDTKRPIYADEESMDYFPAEWNVRALSTLDGAYPEDAVYAVSKANAKVDEAVRNGAGKIDFNPGENLPSLPLSYKQSWWKAGDSDEKNNTGTFVYQDRIVDELTTDRFCGPAWSHLIDGGRKFRLESLPERPKIIIRALNSIVRVYDEAVLFRSNYGKGVVISDGLNHKGQSQDKMSQWILAKIIESLCSACET